MKTLEEDSQPTVNGNRLAPFVFILGMHRSGTSCLAGALELCGLYLGEVRRTGHYNAKGYFENRQLVELHDQILMLNRSTWYSPPASLRLHPRFQEKLVFYAEKLSHHRPCGFKDPRTLLLIEHWLRICSPPHALIGTFRHPIDVSRSLAQRNSMPRNQIIDLWCHYNQRLIELHKQNPFPLIEYSMCDQKAYVNTVAQTASSLGLTPDLPTLHRFVEPTLEHHSDMDQPIPVQCRELYEYLKQNKDTANHMPEPYPKSASHFMGRFLSKPRVAMKRYSYKQKARRLQKELDRDKIEQALFFIGNARSGTTLVRSLLAVHPMVILGNEVNVMQKMLDGRSWPEVEHQILQSALSFNGDPTWNGYSYHVQYPGTASASEIRIIGDKKANRLAYIIGNDTTLLSRFVDWVPFPITFLQCIRHPMDVIATKCRYNGMSVERNIERYADTEAVSAFVGKIMGTRRFIRIYHEQLIANPERELRSLLTSLELPVSDAYLHACLSLINPHPHRTRDAIDWTPDWLSKVQRRVNDLPHLACYADQIGIGVQHAG